MDQVYVVRHRVLVDGLSVRQVAREMGISRNTVKRYVDGAPPSPRQPVARERPAQDAAKARLHALLDEAPRWTGGKQRLTATRLHRMLRDEGIGVGETVVKEIVREWKRQRQEVFVPLQYRAGDLAEVDFFEVLVDVAGERCKAHMFVMRLMHSGRDFAWLYPRQDQTCFLDGHVRAFRHFGAVPHRIAYDNLRAAVRKFLAGSERALTARMLALTTHYLFEASFARPHTGHDKGGVEARGKGIRWQELVPIPSGASLHEIGGALVMRLDAGAETRRDADGRSVAERYLDERAAMLPAPATDYIAARCSAALVSRRALVKVDGAVYSVWSRWAGLDVTVYAGVDEIAIVGPDDRVVHQRARFGGRVVDYRHYIPELARKPQAVRQVADGLTRDLGAPYDALWRHLVDLHGPKQAARVFAKVLGHVVELGDAEVRRRIESSLATDEPVLLTLRSVEAAPQRGDATVPAALARVDVEAPCLADFDVLLSSRGAR
jgi:transposase